MLFENILYVSAGVSNHIYIEYVIFISELFWYWYSPNSWIEHMGHTVQTFNNFTEKYSRSMFMRSDFCSWEQIQMFMRTDFLNFKLRTFILKYLELSLYSDILYLYKINFYWFSITFKLSTLPSRVIFLLLSWNVIQIIYINLICK